MRNRLITLTAVLYLSFFFIIIIDYDESSWAITPSDQALFEQVDTSLTDATFTALCAEYTIKEILSKNQIRECELSAQELESKRLVFLGEDSRVRKERNYTASNMKCRETGYVVEEGFLFTRR